MVTRRPVVLSCAAAVVLATSGCAFLTDLAVHDPPAAPSVPEPSVTTPTTPPPEPVEVATAALADRNDLAVFSGEVRIAVRPVDGLPPLPGAFAADCALADDGSVRTTAVDVTFVNGTRGALAGLAATVTLTAADGGAPVPGAVVLVESSAPDVRWCHGDTTTPTTDGFSTYAAEGTDSTVTTYVLAPATVPAADLVLRVSAPRNAAGSNAAGPWDQVTVGLGACPDDPAALCAPLG